MSKASSLPSKLTKLSIQARQPTLDGVHTPKGAKCLGKGLMPSTNPRYPNNGKFLKKGNAFKTPLKTPKVEVISSSPLECFDASLSEESTTPIYDSNASSTPNSLHWSEGLIGLRVKLYYF